MGMVVQEGVPNTESRERACLKRIIEKICEKSPKLNVEKDKIEGKIDEVFINIEKYKNIMEKFMEEKDPHEKATGHLDRHKLAAAFCCAVLKTQPINYIADNTGIPGNNFEYSANQQCAYFFGLQVIQDFWSAKGKESIFAEDKDIYSQPIRTPRPNDIKTTYADWFVKLFNKDSIKHFDYKNDLFGEKLIFIIAHNYFMIDRYSYEFHRAKLAGQR